MKFDNLKLNMKTKYFTTNLFYIILSHNLHLNLFSNLLCILTKYLFQSFMIIMLMYNYVNIRLKMICIFFIVYNY